MNFSTNFQPTLLITAHFFKNWTTFLTNCTHGKVITHHIFSVLRPSHQIFHNYAQPYLETYFCNFKFFEVHTFEEARLIGVELRRKRGMFHSVTEHLRSEISRINNNSISKLKSKFISLCNKSCRKDLCRVDLNISCIGLSTIEREALISD